MRIFRATVRGQFDGLDEGRQAALRSRADEHDILDASFSREGTFVYSPALTGRDQPRSGIRNPRRGDGIRCRYGERGGIELTWSRRAARSVIAVPTTAIAGVL